MKLEALPFQRHGTLSGVVRVIDADALPSTQPGSRESRMAYRARIVVGEGGLHDVPSQFRLMPGMEVTAEIKVGKRTVISYFLDPILRVHEESLKEP
jgi:HlyD family secretion protein